MKKSNKPTKSMLKVDNKVDKLEAKYPDSKFPFKGKKGK